MFYLAIKIVYKIANPKLHISELHERFNNKKEFTTQDIELFYRTLEPDVKYNTVNWRVYALVKSGVLARTGKGKFSLGKSRIFIPELPSTLKNLYRDINRQFPFTQVCVWNTASINEFMLHQPGNYYSLVEVDKEATESVFYFLSEKKNNIFLDPAAEVIERYASKEKNAIIIRSLITEAPTQLIEKTYTITLEKMLVDIFCDELLFAAQQGAEMTTIFMNAFDNYTINKNKMLRYADRRRKKEAFLNYLLKFPKLGQQRPNAASY